MSGDLSLLFIELGIAVLGLALLSRLASRWSISAIPLYLVVGLVFGNGGVLPLQFSGEFVRVGSEIGVVLLLFMLGLEYPGDMLAKALRASTHAGLLNLLLSFTPGFAAGLLMGWEAIPSLLLGGVTYATSSGIVAKVLKDMGRTKAPETATVISILVFEDLSMAVYIPIVAVLVLGQGVSAAIVSVTAAVLAVGAVLLTAIRYGKPISRLLADQSDEALLFATFGLILLVSGIAQFLNVSAAVGAFLIGITLSGPIVERTHRLLGPLRDLFAALFFLFFGLQIDPSTLAPALMPAVGLGVVTAGTKMLTGWWAVRRKGLSKAAALRAGATLVARGEFSLVIASIGVTAGLEPRLGPLAAAYVLLLAVAGPLLARVVAPQAPDSSPAA
jgi:CPA2 family monovalent cation:H+ antiporter-2